MARRGLRQQDDMERIGGEPEAEDAKYVDCPVCWGQGGKCRFCRSTGEVHPDDVDEILAVFKAEKKKRTMFMAGTIGVLVLVLIGLALVGFFTPDAPKTTRTVVKEQENTGGPSVPDLKMDLSKDALLKGFEGHITLEKANIKTPEGFAFMGYTSDREKQGTNTFASMVTYGSEDCMVHAYFCATIPYPPESDASIPPDLLKRNTAMLDLFLFNIFRGKVPPVVQERVDMARKSPGQEMMETVRGLKLKFKYSPTDRKFSVDVR